MDASAAQTLNSPEVDGTVQRLRAADAAGWERRTMCQGLGLGLAVLELTV